MSQNSTECPFYSKGYCNKGKSCKFTHVNRQICPNYVYGFCPEGRDCIYSHPRSIISPEDDSIYKLASLLPFDWTQDNYSKNSNDICHKCGMKGHTYENCKSKKLETGKINC